MFRYNKKLGITDIVIQGLLVLGVVLSVLALIGEEMAVLFILIFQFFLGLYQIGSGIIGAVKRRKWKMIYLGVAFAYLIIGAVSIALLEDARWRNEFAFGLMIFVGMVVPLLIGLAYFILTIREYKESGKNGNVEIRNDRIDDEDILDDLLMD